MLSVVPLVTLYLLSIVLATMLERRRGAPRLEAAIDEP
jgi:Sec-independent protein secretion pathway component TatC